eukprot:7710598-Pyramimonas_sp.AAC.1
MAIPTTASPWGAVEREGRRALGQLLALCFRCSEARRSARGQQPCRATEQQRRQPGGVGCTGSAYARSGTGVTRGRPASRAGRRRLRGRSACARCTCPRPTARASSSSPGGVRTS